MSALRFLAGSCRQRAEDLIGAAPVLGPLRLRVSLGEKGKGVPGGVIRWGAPPSCKKTRCGRCKALVELQPRKQSSDPRCDPKAAVRVCCTLLRYGSSDCRSNEPASHIVPPVSGRGSPRWSPSHGADARLVAFLVQAASVARAFDVVAAEHCAHVAAIALDHRIGPGHRRWEPDVDGVELERSVLRNRTVGQSGVDARVSRGPLRPSSIESI